MTKMFFLKLRVEVLRKMWITWNSHTVARWNANWDSRFFGQGDKPV